MITDECNAVNSYVFHRHYAQNQKQHCQTDSTDNQA